LNRFKILPGLQEPAADFIVDHIAISFAANIAADIATVDATGGFATSSIISAALKTSNLFVEIFLYCSEFHRFISSANRPGV
jgi:hypothetical protein